MISDQYPRPPVSLYTCLPVGHAVATPDPTQGARCHVTCSAPTAVQRGSWSPEALIGGDEGIQ